MESCNLTSHFMPFYVLSAWRSAHFSISSILFYTLETPLVCLIGLFIYLTPPPPPLFCSGLKAMMVVSLWNGGRGWREGWMDGWRGGWASRLLQALEACDWWMRMSDVSIPGIQSREEAQRRTEETHSNLTSDNLSKSSHTFCSPSVSSTSSSITDQYFWLHPHPQPWTTCAAVSLTAPSSPTCPTVTYQTCRNPILPSLLHPGRNPNWLLRSLRARVRTQTQRGNPSLLPSPQVQDSSAPSPT